MIDKHGGSSARNKSSPGRMSGAEGDGLSVFCCTWHKIWCRTMCYGGILNG